MNILHFKRATVLAFIWALLVISSNAKVKAEEEKSFKISYPEDGAILDITHPTSLDKYFRLSAKITKGENFSGIEYIEFKANGESVGKVYPHPSNSESFYHNWTVPAIGKYKVTAYMKTTGGQEISADNQVAVTFIEPIMDKRFVINYPKNGQIIDITQPTSLNKNFWLEAKIIKGNDFYAIDAVEFKANGKTIGVVRPNYKNSSAYYLGWNVTETGKYKITAFMTTSEGPVIYSDNEVEVTFVKPKDPEIKPELKTLDEASVDEKVEVETIRNGEETDNSEADQSSPSTSEFGNLAHSVETIKAYLISVFERVFVLQRI